MKKYIPYAILIILIGLAVLILINVYDRYNQPVTPPLQKVSIDSLKYHSESKRIDSVIKSRESNEKQVIYNITNIINQGKINKAYYTSSDSLKLFVCDSLLKDGGYR